MFDGTAATNIARFGEAATSETILEAARGRGARDDLASAGWLRHGRIGDAGPRCRPAAPADWPGAGRIGRPFLIVFDEPNANLDAEGENALVNAIETLRRQHRHRRSHRSNALAALDYNGIDDGRSIASGHVRRFLRASHGPHSCRICTEARQVFARGCRCCVMTHYSYASGHAAGYHDADNAMDASVGPQGVLSSMSWRRDVS